MYAGPKGPRGGLSHFKLIVHGDVSVGLTQDWREMSAVRRKAFLFQQTPSPDGG